ncbi:MAG: imidazolonepropionase [Acidobacteria bacterium]|nr:imidazolonepropionase [Acidobacteriota bacterium]
MGERVTAVIHAARLLTLRGGDHPRRGPGMEDLGQVRDGALLLRAGRILRVGPTDEVMRDAGRVDHLVDLSGKPWTVLPGFVDSHSHPVFHGTRQAEYELRIRGASYEEIAAQGGGILNSARRVAEADEAAIADQAVRFAHVFLEHGTTTLEAKSGYGLSLEGELKLLRAVRDVRGRTPLDLVPTFLGAHAYPVEYRENHRPYLDLIIREMLPAVAREGLAAFCDAFCDRGFFSVGETREIFGAARALGLKLRLHADELAPVGAAELAAEMGALSADHLERVSDDGIRAMAEAGTIAGLLPGTAFNLGLEHYPPARRLIEAGVPVALATDFNPGTCFTPNLQLVMAIACTQMRMTPAEALVAATVNGAWSLGLGHDRGTLEAGKRADFTVMDCDDYRLIPYLFGVNHCVETFKDGRPVRDPGRWGCVENW